MFYQYPESSQAFYTTWRKLVQTKSITAADVATLALYRSLNRENPSAYAATMLKRFFRPITNNKKLFNGAYASGSLYLALAANAVQCKKEPYPGRPRSSLIQLISDFERTTVA